MSSRWLSVLAGVIALGTGSAASAQQNFLPGFAGLKDGTQAPPGLYAGAVGWGYSASTVFTASGQSVPLSTTSNEYLVGALISVVTKLQLLGANYGFTVLVPWASARLEIPRINVNSGGGWGLTSIYLQPVNFGWHTTHADFLLGYALYFPSGGYTFGGNTNFGLGMYTQEISGGTTLYLNAHKSVHLALELVYDINSLKKDTTFRQSDPLTLQGGFGANYGKASEAFSGWFGVTGYGQWTLHPTQFGVNIGPLSGTVTGPYPKNYGIGPEFVTLQGALTLRYLWQLGTRSAFQGGLWYAQFVMPIPL